MQKGHLSSAPLPTLEKYLFYSKKIRRMSLTRAMQYDLLGKLAPLGRLLDVGGGENAGYKSLISYDIYESINIDPKAEPTWAVGIGERFPCQADTYDAAISLNTFEHVFDVHHLLSEIYRVLKPRGRFIASVPFLHPLHAHPDDFFRPTPSWLFQSLIEKGYKNIDVRPLGWGPYSTGAIASGAPGPFRSLQHQIALLADLVFMKLQKRRKPEHEVGEIILKHALGFFVTANK